MQKQNIKRGRRRRRKTGLGRSDSPTVDGVNAFSDGIWYVLGHTLGLNAFTDLVTRVYLDS